DHDRLRKYAAELVALAPDVILAAGALAVASLQRATRTVPIVPVNVADPVGAGYVATLARPGGNATGFASIEFGLSAKLLELLKEVAPRVVRVAVVRNPANPVEVAQFGAIQAVAQSLGMELSFPHLYFRAATYVDKVFRGAKPADLPVEQPTKSELITNLKPAKAPSLDVPPMLLARSRSPRSGPRRNRRQRGPAGTRP